MTTLSPHTTSEVVQVDGQSPESWSAVISNFADATIYQSWAYGSVRWGAKNLSHLVLRRNEALVGAAQLRIVKVPFVRAGIAYLRWGPLCVPAGTAFDEEKLSAMLKALRDEYVLRRGLTLEIVPQVYSGETTLEPYAAELQKAGFTPVADSPTYRTMIVDLTPPVEELRKRLQQKWRNQLNGSERNGIQIEMSDSAEAYGVFLGLYDEMWQRKRFETSVDPAEFARIQDELPPTAKMQTFVARKDGEAVGAVVCSQLGTTAIYLLGATNDKARQCKAAYLLQWQAMLWLKSRGAQQYDLGGIDPETNPGGFHFKEGFGGADRTQLSVHSLHRGVLNSLVRAAIARRRAGATKATAPAAG